MRYIGFYRGEGFERMEAWLGYQALNRRFFGMCSLAFCGQMLVISILVGYLNMRDHRD